MHLMKMLHIQLNTKEQLQLVANVRVEEIAHVIHVIPQDGVIVAPMKNHIVVAITNIMLHMILKRCFMAVASTKKHDEQELEQVSSFGKILSDIIRYSQNINLGDFIPVFKWMDAFGLERQM